MFDISKTVKLGASVLPMISAKLLNLEQVCYQISIIIAGA